MSFYGRALYAFQRLIFESVKIISGTNEYEFTPTENKTSLTMEGLGGLTIEPRNNEDGIQFAFYIAPWSKEE